MESGEAGAVVTTSEHWHWGAEERTTSCTALLIFNLFCLLVQLLPNGYKQLPLPLPQTWDISLCHAGPKNIEKRKSGELEGITRGRETKRKEKSSGQSNEGFLRRLLLAWDVRNCKYNTVIALDPSVSNMIRYLRMASLNLVWDNGSLHSLGFPTWSRKWLIILPSYGFSTFVWYRYMVHHCTVLGSLSSWGFTLRRIGFISFARVLYTVWDT